MASERNLEDGEQQIIRRGQRPAEGWHNRTVIQMEEEGEQWLISAMPRKRPSGGSGGGTAPPPETPAPPDTTLVGYGDAVTGGDAGPTTTVTTWAGLVSAVNLSRPRVINFSGSSNIDGGGDRLDIDGDDLTLTMAGWGGSIKKGWIRVTGPASNIKFEELRIRPGDEVDAPDDCDPISVNAANGEIDGVVVLKCSLMWGPDIGGLSLITRRSADGGLGNIRNVTVQQSILGPGLSLSAHSEGTIALNGHAKAMNITNIATAASVGDISTIDPRVRRVTLYQSIFMGAEERTPQVHYASEVDMVDCLTYDWRQKGLDGNPNSMNVVGNLAKIGPALTAPGRVFYYNPLPANHDKPASIYLTDNRGIGFTAPADNIPAVVKSGTILNGGLYHVTAPSSSEATATRLSRILTAAGPTIRDAVDADLIAKIMAGDSVWFNGVGKPAPNPYWPAP